MPCYRAKSDHLSVATSKPGIGASWTTFWANVPCCSSSSSSATGGIGPSSSSITYGGTSSSSSTGGGTTSSSSTGGGASSSSSAGPAATGAKFVSGAVPDWNQPYYYETAGQGTAQITGNAVTNPSAQGGNYAALTATALKAWCAPAAAACQLGHLQHHYSTRLMNIPPFIGDGIDAGTNVNPNMTTHPWNTIQGWGDHMLDGPNFRGKLGSQNFNGCGTTDFGWWMDTNGAGFLGGLNYTGTTTGLVYSGLQKFYAHAGYTNILGMAYHLPHNTSTLVTMGNQPYSNNTNADMTQVWNAIVNELDNNRTIVATTMGYEIWSLSLNRQLLGSNNGNETHAGYFRIGDPSQISPANSPNTPMVDGVQGDNTGEAMSWEVYDSNGIGHTVLIVGYIEANSVDDIGPSFGSPGTNWVIVRDNLNGSDRNVALPFDNVTTGGWTLWELLLSTCYTRPTTTSYSSTCKTSATSSSSTGGGQTSSQSSSATGTGSSYAPGYHKYLVYPCGDFTSVDCASQWETLSGGLPTQIWHSDDTASKFVCNTNTGGTLDYTVTRVWGVTGLSAGQCALLIRDDTITPVSVMYQVGTGTQTCNACAYTLTTGDESGSLKAD